MVATEGAPAHGQPAHLLPNNYKRLVTSWLEEDSPSFDYGGFVVGEGASEARLLGKSPGIVAGVPFFDEVFAQLGCSVEWHVAEGAAITPVTHCATVRGPIRAILQGERVALNTLARCAGIASKTAATLALVRSAGYRGALAGTRKTTPGFRLVEKYGMLVGGADPHRQDLSAMIMLKDNHIWACSGAAKPTLAAAAARGTTGLDKVKHVVAAGSEKVADATASAVEASRGDAGAAAEAPGAAQAPNAAAITKAVHAAKASAGFALKVEVECQSEAEAEAAVLAGADIVMLDNFEPAALKAAARSLKARLGAGHSFLIEVSGGLTEENVGDYVCDELDVVSTSSIHQGTRHVDFSLKVVHQASA